MSLENYPDDFNPRDLDREPPADDEGERIDAAYERWREQTDNTRVEADAWLQRGTEIAVNRLFEEFLKDTKP